MQFFLDRSRNFFSVRPCIFFWIEYGNIPDRLCVFFLSIMNFGSTIEKKKKKIIKFKKKIKKN